MRTANQKRVLILGGEPMNLEPVVFEDEMDGVELETIAELVQVLG